MARFHRSIGNVTKITLIADRETAIPTADLTKLCVHINIQKKRCLRSSQILIVLAIEKKD